MQLLLVLRPQMYKLTVGCLCSCHADTTPCADLLLLTVKVITGSLQGVLRVHQPHQQGYHIEDILLEAQLDSSILQLAAGNFMGYVVVLIYVCLHIAHSSCHSVQTRLCILNPPSHVFCHTCGPQPAQARL